MDLKIELIVAKKKKNVTGSEQQSHWVRNGYLQMLVGRNPRIIEINKGILSVWHSIR